MRRFPRPSHMPDMGGGCFGWLCLLALAVVCWPLAIPAVIIYGFWCDAGEDKQQTIFNVIFLIAIGFIAIACPILCFASLFNSEILPISDTWWM